MDPLTHGMIGLAISTFSGQAVALNNPLAIGCAVGAMVPDLDSVIRLFSNDAVYLKHHRGLSHSVPALAIYAAVIGSGLYVIFPEYSFFTIALWTFIGALSHTFFDILNSYGAMLLTKKRKLNLLTLYDPVIALLGIGLIAQRQVHFSINLGVGFAFLMYMVFRYRLRKMASQEIETRFDWSGSVNEVAILPALTAFHKWDFIVNTTEFTYVGKYNQWTKALKVIERLDAQCSVMRQRFDATKLGAYFNDFSPHLHVVDHHDGNQVVLRVIDLRYYVKNRFLHQATLVLDAQSHQIQHSALHPYGQRRTVTFNEVA